MERCDVLVVGGGAAGLMAAGRAATRGLRVTLLERNDRVGKKVRRSFCKTSPTGENSSMALCTAFPRRIPWPFSRGWGCR